MDKRLWYYIVYKYHVNTQWVSLGIKIPDFKDGNKRIENVSENKLR